MKYNSISSYSTNPNAIATQQNLSTLDGQDLERRI